MRSSLILLMFALASTPAMARYNAGLAETERHPDPIELGQLFCNARVADDMSLLGGHLAPVLLASIDEAEAKAEALLKQRSAKPPPFGDGLPWQTSSERPSHCSVEMLNSGVTNAPIVLVKLNYFVAGETSPKWSDTIQLDRTPTSWLIDNVFYDKGGNMRFKLVEAFN